MLKFLKNTNLKDYKKEKELVSSNPKSKFTTHDVFGLMDKDFVSTLPVPGYLYEWAAGLVHDCPRVGGQRPAEEGGAQVHRHRGEPKHTERDQPLLDDGCSLFSKFEIM